MRTSHKRQPLSEREQQTFHELYQAHYQRVYAICFRMTRDVSEAEDLTQDVFLHLFRTIDQFNRESAFTTWLHRVTVNTVLMHFRKRKTRPEVLADVGELPVRNLFSNRDLEGLRVVNGILLSEVLAKLPAGYREAVVLHDVEGLEHNEIAALKGRAEGTSKSQLHKGRVLLRQMITQERPEHAIP
ncbi:MAG TPA: RNA polymerase sigma factor [Pyrinomonadaceae bacterium]|nr:RNA polymerase sigma factor [Pyrinomonadaceae bacterium]